MSTKTGASSQQSERGPHEDYQKWIEKELQRAYDLLWDGDGEGCDAITARLPEKEVKEMLDGWLDDQIDSQDGKAPKSKWYEPK